MWVTHCDSVTLCTTTHTAAILLLMLNYYCKMILFIDYL